jgi:glucosamine--fructose-6-phosphate aminotransferase (isomerizing)
MVSHGFPVLAVAPTGKVFDSMLKTLTRLKMELSAELVIISNSPEALKLAQVPLTIPLNVPEWLSPVVSIVPAQLFSYYLTLAKGYNPDAPRTISKVTETR